MQGALKSLNMLLTVVRGQGFRIMYDLTTPNEKASLVHLVDALGSSVEFIKNMYRCNVM